MLSSLFRIRHDIDVERIGPANAVELEVDGKAKERTIIPFLPSANVRGAKAACIRISGRPAPRAPRPVPGQSDRSDPSNS
jgi:hypothetical protein